MTKLPTYDLLLVELQATLEALIKYAKSDSVKDSAKKRKTEIERIKKNREGFYLDQEIKKIA